MSIAKDKKRVMVTLPLDRVDDLKKLVDYYESESIGRVTASDVVDQLIKDDLKIRQAFRSNKQKQRA